MIRHIVAVRFRAGVTQGEKDELMTDLRGLSEHIAGIQDFQVRRNVSPEDPVVRGFHDLFWFDFRDEQVRDVYLDDKAHQAIGARLVAAAEGGVDGIFVIDHEI